MQGYPKIVIITMISIIALSMIPQFFLPFPFGLMIGVSIVFTIPYIFKKVMLSKYGYGSGAGRFGGIERGSKLTKICTVCGLKTKDRKCKRCGSNSFKMS